MSNQNEHVCIAHPDRPAVTSHHVPCAPGGKVWACEECRDIKDPAVMKRVFEAYRAGHGKRIELFKTPGHEGN